MKGFLCLFALGRRIGAFESYFRDEDGWGGRKGGEGGRLSDGGRRDSLLCFCFS